MNTTEFLECLVRKYLGGGTYTHIMKWRDDGTFSSCGVNVYQGDDHFLGYAMIINEPTLSLGSGVTGEVLREVDLLTASQDDIRRAFREVFPDHFVMFEAKV